LGEASTVGEQNGGIRRTGERDGTRKREHETTCSNGRVDGRKDGKVIGADGKSRKLKEVKVILRLMVSQSVRPSWCPAPSGAHDQMVVFVKTGFVENKQKRRQAK
jgi:hypothetical protein